MKQEFFPSSDSRQTGAGSTEDAPFSAVLARLFHAASEAGAPPLHLRALLALEHWLPIALPDAAVCAAAAARTRTFAPADGRSNKKKRAFVPENAQNARAYRVVDAQSGAIDALQALQQLPEAVSAVLLQFEGEFFGFNRAQCQALLRHFQGLAERRTAALQEQHDLRLLAGDGTLAEFLAMPVRVHAALHTLCTAGGEVLALQTRGYSSSRSDTITLPLLEVAQRVQTRRDFIGVQINRSYSGGVTFEFGPNFAAWCLAGQDPRHAGPCPALAIRDIEFGMYLTRPFARMNAQRKAMIAMRLAQARTLLAAIEPGEPALAHSAVISMEGERGLRRFPQVAERVWLNAFIARAERALRTRWRIGVF